MFCVRRAVLEHILDPVRMNYALTIILLTLYKLHSDVWRIILIYTRKTLTASLSRGTFSSPAPADSLEHVQAPIRGHQVSLSDEGNVPTRRRRNSDHVLPAVDRYQRSAILRNYLSLPLIKSVKCPKNPLTTKCAHIKAPSIFKSLGLNDNTTSLLATGVVGILLFVFTIPAVLWIDRVGRKPVLTVGAIGMATCHIIISVIIAKDADRWASETAAGWAAVAFVWIFVINFGYSWGPCAWIIIAEIWPLSSRPYGVTLGASSNWANNFSK